MKTKKEIHVNRFGLEIETEIRFVEKDDSGNVLNDYFVDEYNMAKMALYKDATALLPFDKEQEGIANILSIGIANYINSNL
mgnify:FL=1